MVLASSKDALCKKLQGIAECLECHDDDEISFQALAAKAGSKDKDFQQHKQ